MPLPFIPIALGASMLGGIGVSAGANLYRQYNQRKLWSKQALAYENLDSGYRNYLSKHGRYINPDRAWTSYFGQAQRIRNDIDNSYASSIGTIGGSFGAIAGVSRSLYRAGHSSRWL